MCVCGTGKRERERDKEGNPWESVIHQRDTAPTPPWATACARPHVCQPAAAGHTEWWLSTFLHNKALFIMHLKSHSRYVWTHFICLSFCIDFLNKPSLLSSHPEAAFSSCWCRLVRRVFNLLTTSTKQFDFLFLFLTKPSTVLPHVRGKSRDRGGIWIHKTCLSGSFIAEDHFWIKREHTVRNDLSEKSYY